MKKSIIIVLAVIISLFNLALAEEGTSMYDSMGVFDKYNNYKAKPTATDQEINNAIEKVKNVHKSKRQLKKEKEKKGELLYEGLSSIIKKPYDLLQLPANIYNGEQIIQKGFYHAVYNPKNTSLILKQGYTNIAEIRMNKTKTEPETEELYYIDSSIQNGYVKLIYGAIDEHFERYFKIAN